MIYYYIHFNKPQYFFQEGYTKYPLFSTFYKPYTLTGFISWWLFRNIGFYRNKFKTNDVNRFIPEKEIRRIVGNDAVMVFNTGTPGPEQKVSALGVEKSDKFFVKYAQTEASKNNVTNEYSILKQIKGLSFVPQVLDFNRQDSGVLLKTTVFEGKRMGNISINEPVLNRLLQISELTIEANRVYKSGLKTCFAHGDFCPWNMMTQNGSVLVYDWEMAGIYPLGYDLFTYIFQPFFLLGSKEGIEGVTDNNRSFITRYFNHFFISNWMDYLIEFCKVKIDIENEKGVKGMLINYKELMNYAQKA